ncbi:MAG: (4Fe-4S)-binding protein [Thermoplasmata archaeon]|nr:MAG: (4Fe-4S)-binding protein [Thermoplasmata archaeon]
MIISVASGKGGTGKTTVAVNLALSIDNVQYLDCDVEEPNANIFLKAEITEREDVTVEIPEINYDRCDFCGKCADFCAYNALAVVPSKVLVFPELCHSCGGCELVCPRDAIKWKKRPIGKIEHGSSGSTDFYQGILNVGEATATPLIKALKRRMDKDRIVVLDAPPGTACPVMETVEGSDYCILVTEPTPFGLHDLKLAVEVMKHLSIPFGVVINRDGIGDDRVEQFCNSNRIPVLMKIPHDKRISTLYSRGVPFVKELSGWRERFRKLLLSIEEGVGNDFR